MLTKPQCVTCSKLGAFDTRETQYLPMFSFNDCLFRCTCCLQIALYVTAPDNVWLPVVRRGQRCQSPASHGAFVQCQLARTSARNGDAPKLEWTALHQHQSSKQHFSVRVRLKLLHLPRNVVRSNVAPSQGHRHTQAATFYHGAVWSAAQAAADPAALAGGAAAALTCLCGRTQQNFATMVGACTDARRSAVGSARRLLVCRVLDSCRGAASGHAVLPAVHVACLASSWTCAGPARHERCHSRSAQDACLSQFSALCKLRELKSWLGATGEVHH